MKSDLDPTTDRAGDSTFDEVNERQGSFLRRTLLLGGLSGLGLVALGGRLTQLQLLHSSEYRLLSAENQFNYRLIVPPRGRILDRNGVELAGSRPMFSIHIIRDEVKDVDGALDTVQQLLPMDPARRRRLLKEISQSPRYVPAVIAGDVDWETFSRVNVRAPELPGITADMSETRVYPSPGAFAHVVGYVGKINDREHGALSEEEKAQPVFFHPGFRIGKQGVEKALDAELRGTPAGRRSRWTRAGAWSAPTPPATSSRSLARTWCSPSTPTCRTAPARCSAPTAAAR
jgi:penicillin-binding protein 2